MMEETKNLYEETGTKHKSDAVHLSTKETLNECIYCGYTATRKENLNKHIQYEHEGAEWKYKCETCSKLFKCKEYLNDHVRLDHEKSLLKCKEPGCDAVYISRIGMRDHKYKTHQGRVVSCTKCDYMSFKQGIVNKHFREKHVEQPTLQCKYEECNYSTKSSRCLYQHYQNKHRELSVRKNRRSVDEDHKERTILECDKCEFTAVTPSQLKLHKEGKHGDIKKCQHCDKSFKWANYLRLHIKSVHKDKSFLRQHTPKKSCSITKVETVEFDNIKTKNGKLSYVCPFCNVEFPTPQQMNLHFLSHFTEDTSGSKHFVQLNE